jgi:hypothetical protein
MAGQTCCLLQSKALHTDRTRAGVAHFVPEDVLALLVTGWEAWHQGGGDGARRLLEPRVLQRVLCREGIIKGTS